MNNAEEQGPQKDIDWQAFTVENLDTGQTRDLFVPDRKATPQDARLMWEELEHARETVADAFTEAVRGVIADTPETIARPVGALVVSYLLGAYSELLEAAAEEGDRGAIEQAQLITLEGDTALFNQERAETLTDSPPEWLHKATVQILESYQKGSDLGEWMATHIIWWARRDMERELGTGFGRLTDKEWHDELEARVLDEDGTYFADALSILAERVAAVSISALKDAAELDNIDLQGLDRLLGLTAGDAPEIPEMSRDPFRGKDISQGGKGRVAALLAGPFARVATNALMDAEGGASDNVDIERGGAWGFDMLGRVTRVEALGNPYEGKAIFTIQGQNTSPAAMDAQLGQALLKEVGMDVVWVHLLLLAHASDTGRRGERSPMHIPRGRVERALGLSRDRSHGRSVAERYGKARKVIRALSRVFVKFQNVKRHGNQLFYSGDSTESPLWNLSLPEYGQVSMFDDSGSWGWHLVAQEGLWAEKFLHDNQSPQWTWLPVEFFDTINRTRKGYAQRLAPYLLFLHRAQAKNGHRVQLTSETLLKVCQVEPKGVTGAKKRREVKVGLWKALQRLEDDYGFTVDASEVTERWVPWGEWRGRCAYFDPPEVIAPHLFKSDGPATADLPSPTGKWTAAQIKALRKKLGLTGAEFGNAVGISKSYVSKLENKHKTASRKLRRVLDKLAKRA